MGPWVPGEEVVWLRLGSSPRGKNWVSRLGILINLSTGLSLLDPELPEGKAGTYERMS